MSTLDLRTGAALSFALAVSACATAPPPANPVLTYDRSDCRVAPVLSDAVSLTSKRETNGHVVTTPVGEQCLQGPAGPAPYVLYALPADTEDKTIAIGGVLEEMRIFSPSVSTLDSSGRVTRAFRAEEFFHRGAVYSVQFRPRAEDAYVLVTSEGARVGERYDAINVGTSSSTLYAGGGYANITTGFEAQRSRIFSHEGFVEVIVYDSDVEEDRR